jgi:hypothetical protein
MEDMPPRDAKHAVPKDDGLCHCPEPLTDEDVGVESDEDQDHCWRCGRAIDLDG